MTWHISFWKTRQGTVQRFNFFDLCSLFEVQNSRSRRRLGCRPPPPRTRESRGRPVRTTGMPHRTRVVTDGHTLSALRDARNGSWRGALRTREFFTCLTLCQRSMQPAGVSRFWSKTRCQRRSKGSEIRLDRSAANQENDLKIINTPLSNVGGRRLILKRTATD